MRGGILVKHFVVKILQLSVLGTVKEIGMLLFIGGWSWSQKTFRQNDFCVCNNFKIFLSSGIWLIKSDSNFRETCFRCNPVDGGSSFVYRNTLHCIAEDCICYENLKSYVIICLVLWYRPAELTWSCLNWEISARGLSWLLITIWFYTYSFGKVCSDRSVINYEFLYRSVWKLY
jgi:hypothetical protein